MTKRQPSVSPLSPRKRQASGTMSSEESDIQSAISSESTRTACLFPSTSSGSRSSSPTQVSSNVHTSTPEQTSGVKSGTKSSSPLSSALPSTSVLDAKVIVKSNELLAPPSTDTNLAAKISPIELLIPEPREPSHDDTIMLPCPRQSVQPSEANALVHFKRPDAFPNFRSGDVVIKSELVSTPVIFQLHSAVLARHSPWFKNAFESREFGSQSSSWWTFSIEKVNDKVGLVPHHTNGDRPTILPVSQEPVVKIEETVIDSLSINTSIESPGSEAVAVAARRSTEHSTRLAAAVGVYTQVFGTFYNTAPTVSTSDIDSALVQSEELTRIAGDLGCLHLIRPYLGNVFGQYRQELFIAIKSNPPRWILLAIALENASIYTEGLIHLVGAYPTWPWSTKRTALHPELLQLIAQKSAALDTLCIEVERDLLIATIRVGRDPVSPHERGNTDTWIIVQVFRDAIARHFHSIGNNSGKKLKTQGTFFRGLAKRSYMDAEDVRDMCQQIMTSSWKELGDDLKTLKQYAAEVVEELADNQLMIDPDAHGVGYLTCTKIEPKDFPWQTTE